MYRVLIRMAGAERINTKFVHTEEIQNVTGQEGNLHDSLSFCYKINLTDEE